tara:strand:+ start:482 stop:673 length:192 start_codon:yes stop_codon:yes gene_type:complete
VCDEQHSPELLTQEYEAEVATHDQGPLIGAKVSSIAGLVPDLLARFCNQSIPEREGVLPTRDR